MMQDSEKEHALLAPENNETPKCCCCDIRIGLAITFFLNLAFGITSLVTHSYPTGVVWTIIALSGIISIYTNKCVKASLILFLLGQLVIFALSILAIATAKSATKVVDDEETRKQIIGSIYMMGGMTCLSAIIFGVLHIIYMRRYLRYLNK